MHSNSPTGTNLSTETARASHSNSVSTSSFSSNRERKQKLPFQEPPPVEGWPPTPLAASVPKEESFYAQLLRFHKEKAEVNIADQSNFKPAAIKPLSLGRGGGSLSFRRYQSRPNLWQHDLGEQCLRSTTSRSTSVPTHIDVAASSRQMSKQQQQHQHHQLSPQVATRQSSFYNSVMQAAGLLENDHHFIEKAHKSRDEQLAKELAALVEKEDRDAQLRDEALARELTEKMRMEEMEETKRDERLAQEYMETMNREMTLMQKQNRIDLDEVLALELMRKETITDSLPRPSQQNIDDDAAFALALAETEESLVPPISLAIPEQLKILDQIQKQSHSPAPISHSKNDYLMSQQIAMQEWIEHQEQQNPQWRGTPRRMEHLEPLPNRLTNQEPWNGHPIIDAYHPLDSRQAFNREPSNMSSSSRERNRTISPAQYNVSRPMSLHRIEDRPYPNTGQRPTISRFLSDQQHRFTSEHDNNFHSSHVSTIPRGPPTVPDSTAQSSSALFQRGHVETRNAMDQGMSHVVQCRGCRSRLHAPMSYSLVFCPNCHTVSPGQTAARLGEY
jgi:hypothetical protein